MYPNSTPEFRIVIDENNNQTLQIRYINTIQNYVGNWNNVPIVKQELLNNN
jgi:hypothetical protein